MNWIVTGPLILATIGFVVACQLLLKWRAGLHGGASVNADTIAYLRLMLFDFWVWLALFSAGLAALTWMIVLRRADLSLAYPMVALVFLAVPLSAYFLFSEPLPLVRIAGLALIAAGVVLVAQTS